LEEEEWGENVSKFRVGDVVSMLGYSFNRFGIVLKPSNGVSFNSVYVIYDSVYVIYDPCLYPSYAGKFGNWLDSNLELYKEWKNDQK